MKRDRESNEQNIPKFAFIPLISKKVVTNWTKISFDHFEIVSQFQWYESSDGYAISKQLIDGKTYNMHNFIYKNILKENIPSGHLIDHIDRDKLNNTVQNLRIITKQNNSRNKSKPVGSSSQFYNVVALANGTYSVNIQFNGKSKFIGSYKTELRAAEMRDVYLLQKFKNFESSGFNLNFPERKTELEKMEFEADCKRTKMLSYIGVTKSQNKHYPFVARANIEKKRRVIGIFQTEIEAAKAYDDFLIAHKLDRKLNFDYPNYVPQQKIRHKTCNIDNDESKIGLIVGSDVVIIDKEDYDRIKYGRISKTTNGKQKFVSYCIRFIDDGAKHVLARFITNTTDTNLFVDHLDSDTKNNSKSNLDVCAPAGNNEGRKKLKTASSQFYGVRKSEYGYRTVVVHQGKRYSAYFKNEYDAALANDVYVSLHLKTTKKRKNFNFWNPEKLEAERIRLNTLLPSDQNKL